MSRWFRVVGVVLVGMMLGWGPDTVALTSSGSAKHHSSGTSRSSVAKTRVAAKTSSKAKRTTKASAKSSRRRRGAKTRLAVRRSRHYEHFSASSYADNLTLGDVTDGEDPVVRAAAIEALGNMNGTALVIDPSNGRILAMVNQKLALSRGAEPCSTIKLSVALAALEEGIVKKDTPVNLGGHYRMTMTDALAHSNNAYFETLGRSLGFERVKHYANEFGLGELAGYHIQGEQLGVYPDEVLPAKRGGVGRMCSFGESISMTPLQLGALVSAIANGGTLYYLQHPESAIDIASFQPRVKRQLNIAPLIPEIVDGMEGAVRYGTARSLRTNFSEFPVMGKTGTCSNNGTRFGWFGSYADTPRGRLVTVFFLEGGRPTFGPKAAELTGQLYRALWEKSYFTPKTQQASGVLGTE
ncbi:penicillin-binding transpeptidase domain-containing protein [Edaphobacter sp. 12200R-103]|uniref:penicillin-binding transpeptidase domain-containing protein n=1 Tax=Edaphobacter sp. 12200R-103 TaxID=2703788 RepID=UPI001EE405B1|nr:penicillin-binding transpeptidase domain-containing protein [Edaphobacter sp. 12200R-103]